MSITEERFTNPEDDETQLTTSLPAKDLAPRYGQAQEAEVKNLLPSQIETGLKLEERQETTRSQLATFLIKILAGTITASFVLIIILIVIPIFMDQSKMGSFDTISTLVKDLITFILTAQTGLIGTALGFYFGSRVSSKD